MQSLEYIDNYFKGALSEEEIKEFEKKILEDPAFAEEVAFYCNTMQAARIESVEEKKQRFKEIYDQPEVTRQENISLAKRAPVRRMIRRIAVGAASVAAIVVGWFMFLLPPLQVRMADKYIKKELQTLPGTMSTTSDELERGAVLYKEQKFLEAQKIFENVLQKDTASTDAKKYAGLVSLRLRQYDKAIEYFTELGNIDLEINPGKFYKALTLMKRNQPGDKQQAKQLLQEVVYRKLTYHEVARTWLERW